MMLSIKNAIDCTSEIRGSVVKGVGPKIILIGRDGDRTEIICKSWTITTLRRDYYRQELQINAMASCSLLEEIVCEVPPIDTIEYPNLF